MRMQLANDRKATPQILMLSFRDGPKDQTRNLEIPGSRFARPGMTVCGKS
jgi:hypothetical protein